VTSIPNVRPDELFNMIFYYLFIVDYSAFLFLTVNLSEVLIMRIIQQERAIFIAGF